MDPAACENNTLKLKKKVKQTWTSRFFLIGQPVSNGINNRLAGRRKREDENRDARRQNPCACRGCRRRRRRPRKSHVAAALEKTESSVSDTVQVWTIVKLYFTCSAILFVFSAPGVCTRQCRGFFKKCSPIMPRSCARSLTVPVRFLRIGPHH